MIDYLPIIELVLGVVIMPIVLMVMGKKMWTLQAAFEQANANAAAAKENSWQMLQDCKELATEIGRLREEHKEIQGAQNRADENLNKFAETVSQKVETIMRDHAEHEVGQANIQNRLDELVRIAYGKSNT